MGSGYLVITQTARQEPTVATTEQSAELTTDDVFEVLGNQRRRYVFHHLKRHPERDVYLDELADRVAAWEGGKPAADVSQRRYNSVRTALRQSHLPMMDDRGIVEYEPASQTVALAPAAADLDVYVDVVGRGGIPWSLYYLGLTLLFGVSVLAAEVGVPPFAGLGEVAIVNFLLVALSVSALVHTYVSYTKMRLGVGDEPPEVLYRRQ